VTPPHAAVQERVYDPLVLVVVGPEMFPGTPGTPTQAPAPLHQSGVVQAFPSLQLVLVEAGAPPTQNPFPSQWSLMVQTFPSSQEVVVERGLHTHSPFRQAAAAQTPQFGALPGQAARAGGGIAKTARQAMAPTQRARPSSRPTQRLLQEYTRSRLGPNRARKLATTRRTIGRPPSERGPADYSVESACPDRTRLVAGRRGRRVPLLCRRASYAQCRMCRQGARTLASRAIKSSR
jgi:hypothetical protein